MNSQKIVRKPEQKYPMKLDESADYRLSVPALTVFEALSDNVILVTRRLLTPPPPPPRILVCYHASNPKSCQRAL